MPSPLLVALLLAAPTAVPDSVPLYDDLGRYHHEISTKVPKAQLYFDQGFRLTYAFNHGEAIRAFNEAARLDPSCAICHWGAALAYGPNINAAMDSASGVQAYAAMQRAVRLADKATAKERAYIQALATRYVAVPQADRARLDSAYARAMADVVRRYPNDLDAATLYAEALMDLRPWNYWTADKKPQPGTSEMLSQLTRVIAREPNHPGACHFYIHAVEAAQPELAIPCAERLASLMPGAGHLVHMPAHIYIRVGRYADAIESNVHAVHTDEKYLAGDHTPGAYPIAYYPHNYHFLAFAATMAGRSAQAIEAARKLVQRVPADVARAVPAVEPLVPFSHLTLATFGRWDEVLAEPMPPSDLRFATAMAHYARGTALAATGRIDEAEASLDTIQGARAVAKGDMATILEIADHALQGEIAMRTDRLAESERHFREAMRIEDGLLYIEPPSWHYPIRHSLGVVLLRAGRHADAEKLYREDLVRFPENGWALTGLAAALRARGATRDAEAVEGKLRAAWASADIKLAASRY